MSKQLAVGPVIDIWFSKPHLRPSEFGWVCKSVRADAWQVTGNGRTPNDAFEQMKKIIVAAYPPTRYSGVTFV